MLILKSASSNRRDGEWDDDDYDVTLDGKTVGRIFQKTTPRGHWFWGVDFFERKGEGPHQGVAGSRTEAMAAFREAWDRQEAQGSLFKPNG